MKILVDTNVALDILLNRRAFYSNSVAVFTIAEQKFITGYVSAASVGDIFYIAQKDIGKAKAREAIKRLLQVFIPAAVTGNHIFQALDLEWADFEDSIQYIVGEALAVDYIVTRNTKDFSSGSIPSITPEQFIQRITIDV